VPQSRQRVVRATRSPARVGLVLEHVERHAHGEIAAGALLSLASALPPGALASGALRFRALGGGKITLREAQAIAYLLEHGRWPDPETADWFEQRTSRVALDFLLSARLRETIAISAASLREDEEE
jgi:hypothetical protein